MSDIAAASLNGSDGGSLTHWSSGTATNSAKPPCSAMAMAWSPGLNWRTPAPTAATTPAGSLPGTKGSCGLNW
jgi:hypothetical protein